jgi:hypothetical protein
MTLCLPPAPTSASAGDFVGATTVQASVGDSLVGSSKPFIAIATYVISSLGVKNVEEPSALVRELIGRSEELEALPHVGGPAPSHAARAVASAVLAEAASASVAVDRLAATPDGGVMFYFFPPVAAVGQQRRYAALECHEGGELIMLKSDRSAGSPPEVEEISVSSLTLTKALQEIDDYLGRAWRGQ